MKANMAFEHFTFEYLDSIFWERHGKGGATLVIDGIQVTKSLNRHSSNSGKTKDWEIVFTFKDPSGASQEIRKGSRFGTNRRNDATRNWGLPE